MPNLTSLNALTVDTPLPLLGPHLPTFVLSVVACYAIQYAAYTFGPRVVGAGKWAQLDRRTRTGFLTRTVCESARSREYPLQYCAAYQLATVHAVIAIPCAVYALSSKTLQADPVFGYDAAVGISWRYRRGASFLSTSPACIPTVPYLGHFCLMDSC
jgi:hypothetical protein